MSQLLKNLPVGALVKDTNTKYNGQTIIWQVLEHNHDGTGTTTFASRDILTLKCFDAKEPSNTDSSRQKYGNNRYLYSNLLQWLNSTASASTWYTAKHSVDAPPNSSNVWDSSGTAINPYDTEKGFLANFSTQLRNALQTVNKVTAKITLDGGNYETVSSKIFLLSNTEVGLANENSVAEGSIYAYYSASNTGARRQKNLANNATKGNFSSATSPWFWWLRTPRVNYPQYLRQVRSDGTHFYNDAYKGQTGVVPAYVVLSSLTVSDSTDSDGCYTIQWNSPPVINTPSTDLGDKTKAFSTTFNVTDADGNSCSGTVKLDGTTIQTINSFTLGTNYTIAIDVATFRSLALGSHTILITVTDGTETVTKSITFQRVAGIGISGSDGDLGNKWMPFAPTYQVWDESGGNVDVVEKIDGETIRTITDAPQEEYITFGMTDVIFNSLEPEEQHTIQIVVTNANEDSETRTWTFTKLYQYLEFYTDTVETDISAERIYVVLDYDKTNNPEIQVLVCNDAGGIEWHYEDATEDVLNGEPHTFHYTPSEGTEGVSVMVRLIKNENTERVYFNNIGFTFS